MYTLFSIDSRMLDSINALNLSLLAMSKHLCAFNVSPLTMISKSEQSPLSSNSLKAVCSDVVVYRDAKFVEPALNTSMTHGFLISLQNGTSLVPR